MFKSVYIECILSFCIVCLVCCMIGFLNMWVVVFCSCMSECVCVWNYHPICRGGAWRQHPQNPSAHHCASLALAHPILSPSRTCQLLQNGCSSGRRKGQARDIGKGKAQGKGSVPEWTCNVYGRGNWITKPYCRTREADGSLCKGTRPRRGLHSRQAHRPPQSPPRTDRLRLHTRYPKSA